MEQFTWEYGLVHEGSVGDGLSHVGRIGYHGFEVRRRDDRPCVQVGAVVYGGASTRSPIRLAMAE